MLHAVHSSVSMLRGGGLIYSRCLRTSSKIQIPLLA